jgi:hypothetical protein
MPRYVKCFPFNLRDIKERFKMRLMRFDFSISHVAGKDLNIADTLSRAPVENMSQSDTDFKNETKAFVDILAGNSAKSFVLSNGTKCLWSVSNLNLVPIK